MHCIYVRLWKEHASLQGTYSDIQEAGQLSCYSDGLGPGLDSRQCKIFLYSTASRPVLGPTQSPIQWLPRAPFPGYSDRGVKLTTHLQLAVASLLNKLPAFYGH
jgi:hypothetical protein